MKLKKEELLEVLKIWYTGEHTQAYKQIWELIQKPEVTEEFMEKWGKKFAELENLPLIPLNSKDKFMPAYIITMKQMLKEVGVEIVGK